ncbi:uncharacterized protein [Branchiostoma lanceolatum]|uniref:uncharacterized protein n=1 Tax=Branchiostoma lanceolatum TaxID=7740 RepID=UPI0034539C97
MPDEVSQSTTEPKVVYFGKQVQCAGSTDMFSSGFFPPVQTRLMRELQNRPSLWRDGAKCVDRNVEGLIKLSPNGRAVNICVRSAQGDKVQCGKMLQQLGNIIGNVLYDCSPGTGTVENVLSSRALKEHREEYNSYSKEEISKATTKDGAVVQSILKFTEQVSDLLCGEDVNPELVQASALQDTEETKVFQAFPCEVDPCEEYRAILKERPDELQYKEYHATRNSTEMVQARMLQGTAEMKVSKSVQTKADRCLADKLKATLHIYEPRDGEHLLSRTSSELIRAHAEQDTVQTKVFHAVQSEDDPQGKSESMPTHRRDELLDREYQTTRNSAELVNTCAGQDTEETKVLHTIRSEVDTLMPAQRTDELKDWEDPLSSCRNRPELVQTLMYKVEPILDHLLSRDILTVEECANIKANSIQQEKARALLEIVGTKGEVACNVFIDVLKEVSPHAAEIIQGRASAQLYKEEKDPLEMNRPELVYTLKHVEPILDRLLSRGSLSDEECNRIRAKETPEDKARELLDIVATKDKGAREVFKEVLEEVNPNAADLV